MCISAWRHISCSFLFLSMCRVAPLWKFWTFLEWSFINLMPTPWRWSLVSRVHSDGCQANLILMHNKHKSTVHEAQNRLQVSQKWPFTQNLYA
jgi:hypothetical protein